MKCLRCQQDNPPHAKFCLECGTPVHGAASDPGTTAREQGQADGLRRSLAEALKREQAAAELLQTRTQELADAREQQTATSEILGLISRSPAAVEPVFEAIAQRAARLCEALDGGVFRFDGTLIHLVAQHGWDRALDTLRRVWPRPPGQDTATGRAILTGAVVHIDIAGDRYYEQASFVQAGFRTVLSVPMLRDGHPIGA